MSSTFMPVDLASPYSAGGLPQLLSASITQRPLSFQQHNEELQRPRPISGSQSSQLELGSPLTSMFTSKLSAGLPH